MTNSVGQTSLGGFRLGRDRRASSISASRPRSPNTFRSNAPRASFAELCALAPTVVFSAAIPGQGGTQHVNEQWQSYWVELFEQQGFGVHDPLRPAIWDDESVDVWYRQNLLVFGRGRVSDLVVADLVHPAQWSALRDAPSDPTLREVLHATPHAIRKATEFRLGQLRRAAR